jgi:hypothetical protein
MMFLEPEEHCGNEAGNGGMVVFVPQSSCLVLLFTMLRKKRRAYFFVGRYKSQTAIMELCLVQGITGC